jgi:hypothetical protein
MAHKPRPENITCTDIIKIFLQDKAVEAIKQNQEKKKTSPRDAKACHSVSTALLKSVAEIGTQSAMKSSRKKYSNYGTRLGPKGTRLGAQAVFLFAISVYVGRRYTAWATTTLYIISRSSRPAGLFPL